MSDKDKAEWAPPQLPGPLRPEPADVGRGHRGRLPGHPGPRPRLRLQSHEELQREEVSQYVQ